MSWLLTLLRQGLLNDSSLQEEKNFAYASFAFAAVTGFCIGGTALANVIGIPYINKRLSLTNAVSHSSSCFLGYPPYFLFVINNNFILQLLISVFFEIIGNLFLSKYILEETVTNTIKYSKLIQVTEFRSIGILSLGSALVKICLLIIFR